MTAHTWFNREGMRLKIVPMAFFFIAVFLISICVFSSIDEVEGYYMNTWIENIDKFNEETTWTHPKFNNEGLNY